MKHTIHHEAFELLQQGEHAQPGLVAEAQVLGLPEPMQRYLSYAQIVGKEPIRTVRLKQQGFMKQQPGQKWLPLVAEQYFTTTPPAFLWHGMIRPFPLVSISATDRFSDGHGNMLIKLWSFITVGDARGPEMDQGGTGVSGGEWNAHPDQGGSHLASRLWGFQLVSLQDHRDRIQPIGKGDEVLSSGSCVCDSIGSASRDKSGIGSGLPGKPL